MAVDEAAESTAQRGTPTRDCGISATNNGSDGDRGDEGELVVGADCCRGWRLLKAARRCSGCRVWWRSWGDGGELLEALQGRRGDDRREEVRLVCLRAAKWSSSAGEGGCLDGTTAVGSGRGWGGELGGGRGTQAEVREKFGCRRRRSGLKASGDLVAAWWRGRGRGWGSGGEADG
ncbi:uncharacterized protein A4U43_C05F28920 [Asparagus officinalis]|uniref:Uncharacterized protein n=1 Tax=Asparagus officinalis TaxID=4686 RepID=A0A5P1EXR3_ASPOF|nr:uncharacterized protein A4U43_C05F28920 [Asparagus officinalis]